jgi:uncharacterized phage protein (TIGR01671 family)
MREHLCRAKRADGEGWIEGYYIKTPLTHGSTVKPVDIKDGAFFFTGVPRICIATETGCVYEIDPSTVGWYILKDDRQGRKIFEGDLVSFDGIITADDSFGTDPNGFIYDENSIHEIEWNDDLAIWEPKFDEDTHWKYKRDTRGLVCMGDCEVVGNIYDNPELIGGAK